MKTLQLLPAIALLAAAGPAPGETARPYAGQDQREVASLSAADIAELEAGGGWGLALPAELNGYPGPAHVLELAAELELSAGQRARTQAIHDAMNAEARALGAQYVQIERHLDAAFAEGAITPEMLAHMTAMAGETRAALRVAHLSAHLEMKQVLNPGQVAEYNRLRGYDGTGGAGHSGHGQHDMKH